MFQPGISGNPRGRVPGPPPSVKVCRKCGEEKPSSAFKRNDGKGHLRSYCRTCDKEHAAKWRKESPDRARENDVRSRLRNIASVYWRDMRTRAKKHDLPFTVTVEDVKRLLDTTTHCPVLGIPLESGRGLGRNTLPSTPSFDRIKGHLGYVPGNVAVISYRANRMKNDATVDELRRLVAWLEQQESNECQTLQ